MKKVWTIAMGLAVGALLTVPVLAAEIRAQIKAVDATAHTITVTEAHQDTTFTVTDATHFLNVAGKELAHGISNGDLRAGRRVVITYDGTKASEVKLVAPAAPAHHHDGNAPHEGHANHEGKGEHDGGGEHEDGADKK